MSAMFACLRVIYIFLFLSCFILFSLVCLKTKPRPMHQHHITKVPNVSSECRSPTVNYDGRNRES